MGASVQLAMRDWTQTAGYPLVSVSAVRNDSTGNIVALRVHQQRYFASLSEKQENSENDQLWHIPCRFACQHECKME